MYSTISRNGTFQFARYIQVLVLNHGLLKANFTVLMISATQVTNKSQKNLNIKNNNKHQKGEKKIYEIKMTFWRNFF